MRVDLDRLMPTSLELVVGGKTYNIKPLTIEQYLSCEQFRAELSKAAGGTLTVQVEAARNLCAGLAPDMPRADIDALNPTQLTRLANVLATFQGGGEGNAVAAGE